MPVTAVGVHITGFRKKAMNGFYFKDPVVNEDEPIFKNASLYTIFYRKRQWCVGRGLKADGTLDPTKVPNVKFAEHYVLADGSMKVSEWVSGSTWADAVLDVDLLVDEAELQKKQATAEHQMFDELGEALLIEDHPLEYLNGTYVVAKEERLMNGYPHLINERNSFHLFFATDERPGYYPTWVLQNKLSPNSVKGFATFEELTDRGNLKTGKVEIDYYLGSWKTGPVNIQVLDKAAIAKREAAAEAERKKVEEANRPMPNAKAVLDKAGVLEGPFLKENPVPDLDAITEKGDGLFHDPDFGCNEESLVNVKTCSHKHDPKVYTDKVSWVRFKDILAKEKVKPIVRDAEMGDDVTQGSVGNCYFCAVLASLAVLRPDVIADMLCGTTEISKSGAYAVKLMNLNKNEWGYVVVDDHIPVKNNRPCFMSSKKANEFWCSLIEKAFAKVLGNYASMAGSAKDQFFPKAGNKTLQVMQMMTGCIEAVDGIDLDIADPDEIWAKTQLFLKNKWPMSAGSKSKENFDKDVADEEKKDDDGGGAGAGLNQEDVAKDAGVVHNHAYSVVGAVEMPNGDKIIRLRNPWGRFEWKGKYADGDKESWTKENIAFVNKLPEYQTGGPIVEKDDGMFFMDYDSFCLYYNTLNFCPIPKDAAYKEYREARLQVGREQANATITLTGKVWENGDCKFVLGKYTVSKTEPWANGFPHYINVTHHLNTRTTCHLLCVKEKWIVSTKFDPSSMGCFGSTPMPPQGGLPVGKREWSCYDKNKKAWVDDEEVTLTIVSQSDERKAEETKAQSAKELREEQEKQIKGLAVLITSEHLNREKGLTGLFELEDYVNEAVALRQKYWGGDAPFLAKAMDGCWKLRTEMLRGDIAKLENSGNFLPLGTNKWSIFDFATSKWNDHDVTIKLLSKEELHVLKKTREETIEHYTKHGFVLSSKIEMPSGILGTYKLNDGVKEANDQPLFYSSEKKYYCTYVGGKYYVQSKMEPGKRAGWAYAAADEYGLPPSESLWNCYWTTTKSWKFVQLSVSKAK